MIGKLETNFDGLFFTSCKLINLLARRHVLFVFMLVYQLWRVTAVGYFIITWTMSGSDALHGVVDIII
jgi:hypothetical protein